MNHHREKQRDKKKFILINSASVPVSVDIIMYALGLWAFMAEKLLSVLFFFLSAKAPFLALNLLQADKSVVAEKKKNERYKGFLKGVRYKELSSAIPSVFLDLTGTTRRFTRCVLRILHFVFAKSIDRRPTASSLATLSNAPSVKTV